MRKMLTIFVIFLLLGISSIPVTSSLSLEHVSTKDQIQPSNFGENDTTPPVTTLILRPEEPDGDNGWYR